MLGLQGNAKEFQCQEAMIYLVLKRKYIYNINVNHFMIKPKIAFVTGGYSGEAEISYNLQKRLKKILTKKI